MTRGRKKDLTIPPTRSLVQQRDYRARKAHYVAELEDRCRRAEEENKQLRQELEVARANMSVPFLYNPLAAEMSAELLHNLNSASESLAKFQDFARSHPLTATSSQGASSSRLDSVRLPPLQDSFSAAPRPHLPPILPHLPSLPPLRSINDRPASEIGIGHHPYSPRRRYCPEGSASPSSDGTEPAHGPQPRRRSISSEPDCCGGYFDCDSFCRARGQNSKGRPVPTVSSNERMTFSPRS
ncbi:hypothetical protein BKA70DRAFT_1420980 [Coprinopsis sp. MPI-PUGE-AT-0042]|nr:hypothetical protein BKA70DRAFT_1420980 [Coprinopsis sp. MPI-PUGE-AT-0042]